MEIPDKPEKNIPKIKKLHTVREALKEVINIQVVSEYTDIELSSAQKELNKTYDEFVNEYGYINSKENNKVFDEDIEAPLLLSIEKSLDDNKFEKSDIFFKATIRPREELSINSVQDALIASLNNKGIVDVSYISEIYNKTENEIIKELGDKIFLNPQTKNYETRDEYLSGNVKEKLKIALGAGEEFKGNVDALKDVQPEDLKIFEIGYKLGSSWIPVEMYRDFVFDLLGTPNYHKFGGANDSIYILYNKFSTEFTIKNKSLDKSNILAESKYGTKRASAYKIIEDTLNLRIVTVRDSIEIDGKKKYPVNFKETQAARAKQELIKNEFKNWITSDEKRVETIEKIYNENFNIYVPREFDGNDLIIPTMNHEIELRKHQKDAVMRILLGGNTLLAHQVGSGKTYTMATAAMVLKESGVAKKPLFVVPNHILKQWSNEFLTLFPTANLLVPTKKDFEMKNRQRFISKIATGIYDAVILSESQFERIPMSPEYAKKSIDKGIQEIDNAITEEKNGDRNHMTIKQYEASKKRLEVKLKKLQNEEKKDNVINFESLGVDFLFCDEAHSWKNCHVLTKMYNVAGVPTDFSQKAYDMLLKTRYITEKNNGKGVIFSTGTPISNSISEMFVMQRYLQEDTLKSMGIDQFDQWASMFGEITTSMELDITGTKYRTKTRFSKFHNIPELLKIFGQVADIKSCDDLNIKRPSIVGGKAESIVLKPSEYVKQMMKNLERRADRVRNSNVDRSEDNLLSITIEGRAAAIDPRLIDENAPVNRDSKIYSCIDKVYEIHTEYAKDKALQLIFLDSGIKLYDVMKQELIEKGINKNEISFIHEAKNEKEKESLFEKCRNGRIRVLIGSTQKMGTGVNAQKRMIALHHLSCPWKPADIDRAPVMVA